MQFHLPHAQEAIITIKVEMFCISVTPENYMISESNFHIVRYLA